jgi:hypothetical protein
MKITKSQLQQIIKEEISAVLGHPEGSCGGMPEEPEDEIEAMASAAIAMIHQLATAAGAEMSTDVSTGEEESIEEVTSDKQRRWACAQKDKPASQRADSLSAAEAEEMCKSKVEEK